MTVANLLEATGAKVDREYYVNDAGRQMDILATSTYSALFRAYGSNLSLSLKMPIKATTLKKSRKALLTKMATAYVRPVADVYKDVPEDIQYAEELDADGNKVVLSGDKENTSMA